MSDNGQASEQRVVLVHYHLFKNAGTSIDRALKGLYGPRWGTIEADSGDHELLPSPIQALIQQSPELVAVSSHTAQIKPWALKGVTVLPVVFVRHPIDRMMSAYEFEKRQDASTLGARRAKELSFPAYVDFFVNQIKARTFRNFQVYRLAQASVRADLPEFERALDAVESLPFVGVVEHFEHSVARLECLARRVLPDLRLPALRANASNRTGPLDARLDDIRKQLGRELYLQASMKNALDLVLWERARFRQFHPRDDD